MRLTAMTVEVLHDGKRVASHARSYKRGHYSTDPGHRPAAHQRHLEWTPSRLVRWAESVGPQTARRVGTILEQRSHPEQGFRSCLGIMRLGKRYTPERLEAAATRAVTIGAFSYRSVKSILEKRLDRAPAAPAAAPPPVVEHPNLRGSTYYAGGNLS